MGGPTSELSSARRAELTIGELVHVVKGSLLGQSGYLLSIERNIALLRLANTKSTVFLRLPAELVSAPVRAA